MPAWLTTVPPREISPKRRVMPDICEGPKRPSTGSEPDTLPSSRGRRLGLNRCVFQNRGKPKACLVFCTTGGRLTLWVIKKTAIVLRQQCSTSFEPWYARITGYDGVQRQVQLRESRQPTKLSGSHLASTNAEKALVIGLGERVYESLKLAALYDVLTHRGCPAGEILKNVAHKEEEVHPPTARISLAKLMTAGKNAIRLSSDRPLPYRIGTSIHISTYGMYGFAI